MLQSQPVEDQADLTSYQSGFMQEGDFVVVQSGELFGPIVSDYEFCIPVFKSMHGEETIVWSVQGECITHDNADVIEVWPSEEAARRAHLH